MPQECGCTCSFNSYTVNNRGITMSRIVQTYQYELAVKNLDGTIANISVEDYRNGTSAERKDYLPLANVFVEDGLGLFIQYGADYEEFETGPGNYTTAIVEMPSGIVKNLPVNQIKFIEGE